MALMDWPLGGVLAAWGASCGGGRARTHACVCAQTWPFHWLTLGTWALGVSTLHACGGHGAAAPAWAHARFAHAHAHLALRRLLALSKHKQSSVFGSRIARAAAQRCRAPRDIQP